jgi:CPA2 family monovalent cation:H+ antiporter-2
MHEEYALLVFLSVGLAAALLFGLITERLKLSPIVGYLLAGVLVGPNTPGVVADPKMAVQLAEIGVVLLMFGVGLHFNLNDLWAVRKIALPGAIGQILAATFLGTIAAYLLGRGVSEGLLLGIAVSVASTVVLIRVLMDNDVLQTSQGHIAVGWLIVEDIFTVLVLVALPAIADLRVDGNPESGRVALSLGMAILKMGALALIVLVVGKRVIPWLLGVVARTRSRELFTLSILVLALAIATGSAVFFGVSMALGAFLAGMVVGQTEVSHQAAADALPMRDAFAVLFFVSVGMLFDPSDILREPLFLLALLAIVLIAKPIVALVIVWTLRYSFRSAITVAIALAQIGEFSFLLADEAIRHELLSDDERSLLVACGIISITLNPLLFRAIGPVEQWLRRQPRLWRLLSERSEKGGAEINLQTEQRLLAVADDEKSTMTAVIVGYGPVGQTAARILQNFKIAPVVVDLNLDTVRELTANNRLAVYGDATRRDILEAAGIEHARYLLVTIPDVLIRTLVIITAKEVQPKLKVFVRARYLQERAWLEEVGATQICIEEAEAALGLALLILREVGADERQIHQEIQKLHQELGVRQDE